MREGFKHDELLDGSTPLRVAVQNVEAKTEEVTQEANLYGEGDAVFDLFGLDDFQDLVRVSTSCTINAIEVAQSDGVANTFELLRGMFVKALMIGIELERNRRESD